MDREDARRVVCDSIHDLPGVMDIYMKQDALRRRYSEYPTEEYAYDARTGEWIPEPPPEFMELEVEWDRLFQTKVNALMRWPSEIRA